MRTNVDTVAHEKRFRETLLGSLGMTCHFPATAVESLSEVVNPEVTPLRWGSEDEIVVIAAALEWLQARRLSSMTMAAVVSVALECSRSRQRQFKAAAA